MTNQALLHAHTNSLPVPIHHATIPVEFTHQHLDNIQGATFVESHARDAANDPDPLEATVTIIMSPTPVTKHFTLSADNPDAGTYAATETEAFLDHHSTACDDEYEDFDDSLEPEPRTSNEMYEAAGRLRKQVWYNRHKFLEWQIERGEVKIVSSDEWHKLGFPESQNYVVDENWDAARKRAKQVEDELGEENLGPWDDFEWGMINGKLSALRWVLGNDWDQLDT